MRSNSFRFVLLLCLAAVSAGIVNAETKVSDEAMTAFTAGEYGRAIEILNRAAMSAPRDAAIEHLLARCYYEDEQFDRAIPYAEKAVSLDPQNSKYHELLGRLFGEKADRSGWFGALSLAKKARKEFETAMQLDQHNFSAMQSLIEFDCSAPGMAGGGENKAWPEIERLSALDPAEGHYAAGNCRRQKKDNETADREFREALALHPKSADLIYDIGDHYMKHNQPEGLHLVLEEGARVAPNDLREKFYRAALFTMEKKDQVDATKLLREYLAKAPKRNNYPNRAIVHYWLGRIEENQNDATSAKREYKEALNLEPKNRFATEALKRLQHD
jgi:tetratricopeptide (TPR) repeat protein